MIDTSLLMLPELRRLSVDQRIALATERGLDAAPTARRLPPDEFAVRHAWSILKMTWLVEKMTADMISSDDPERVERGIAMRRGVAKRARSLLTKLGAVGSA